MKTTLQENVAKILSAAIPAERDMWLPREEIIFRALCADIEAIKDDHERQAALLRALRAVFTMGNTDDAYNSTGPIAEVIDQLLAETELEGEAARELAVKMGLSAEDAQRITHAYQQESQLGVAALEFSAAVFVDEDDITVQYQ